MFAGLCARQWKPDGPSRWFIMIATACFVRTAWDGTKTGSFECSVTSTAEKAKAV
jgi:hypothetical protein